MVKKPIDENKEEAERILRQVDRESAGVVDSHMSTSVEKMKKHFSGADNPEDDHVEIWGKRIGRFLSVIFAIYLVYTLYNFFMR
jgi:predicted translin family RNA/ssDNA-binding protein